MEGELLRADLLLFIERNVHDYCNSQELFLCYFDSSMRIFAGAARIV